MKQIELIEHNLLKHGYVTNFSSIDGDYGQRILRLGGIINRLRNKGWNIATSWENDEQTNCKYTLIHPPIEHLTPKQKQTLQTPTLF